MVLIFPVVFFLIFGILKLKKFLFVNNVLIRTNVCGGTDEVMRTKAQFLGSFKAFPYFLLYLEGHSRFCFVKDQ